MVERGPIVYVVQEPRFKDPKRPGEYKSVNTLPALKYGSLELLLDNDRQTSTLNAAVIVRTLKLKLQHYRDCDFILCAGDPVAIGIACSLAAIANRGKYTALKWDRQELTYFPVPVTLIGEN